MLSKSVLVLAILVIISFVVYDFVNKFTDYTSVIVEITDTDIDLANGNVNEKGEIMINDSDLDNRQVAVSNVEEGSKETITNQDGITTIVYDGFGNKIETKRFNNHPRIKRIKVTTSAKGDKRVLVYSQTGIVENVPQSMLDSVLSVSPDEVANAAGIYETRADKERRKTEVAQVRKNRISKIQSDEYNAIRAALPDPVYKENNQGRPQQKIETESIQEIDQSPKSQKTEVDQENE